LDDYLDMHVMSYLNAPVFKQMAAINDPYSYIPRYTMPKYLICATGDEFFMPDSPQFFWDDLIDEKHLRMVPNAEHSLIGHQIDVITSIATFAWMVVNNVPRPEFSWQIVKSNETASITVTLEDDQQPFQVRVWQAHTLSFIQRDFRLLICDDIEHCLEPIFWYETMLESSNGTYTVSVPAPPEGNGWIGFFIELEYRYGPGNQWPMVFSSEVNIVPDILPFPTCPTCNGGK